LIIRVRVAWPSNLEKENKVKEKRMRAKAKKMVMTKTKKMMKPRFYMKER
jgi:hypothetical protein